MIADGVDGFLVNEGDVDALAEKLMKLMNDEALRKKMGAAAFERSERYAEDRIMKQWTDLFDLVLKEGN